MTKLLKVTVDLVTESTVEDVYIALASLSPIKQTVSTGELPDDKHKPKSVRGPYKKRQNKDRPGTVYERPHKYSDMRLVWDEYLNRVDVDASLKNIGMTRKQIDDMATKSTTIEYTIKRAMRGRGY